jgi:hypothetical protein
MAIPIVQIPSLDPQSIGYATPSAQALAGPTAALGEVARGIAEVGGELGQHAAQVQQMENAFQESEARQKIAGEFANLDLELQRNTDPATYAKKLDETLQRTGAIVQNESFAPSVRMNLAKDHSDIAAQQRIKTAQLAASMTAKRAALALKNEMDAARTYGDRPAFESALNRGGDAGLVLPEQKQSALLEFDQYESYNAMAKAIDADPQTLLEQLNSEDFQNNHPLITPENRERLQSYAVKKNNLHKAETWDQIAIAGMEGTILSREDILTMAKEGDISPAQAGSYINAYHGPTPPTHDPLLFESARSQILAYDPANDESGAIRAQIAANIATLALPKESIRELQNQFQARVDPKKSEQPRHRLAAEYEKRLDQEWKTEAFGNWFEYQKNPIDGRIAQKIINEKDFDTALSYKDKVSRYFNHWLNQQPDDLDPLDAGKKYNEIKADILKNHTPVDIEIPSFAPIPTFTDPLEGTTPNDAPGEFPKTSYIPNAHNRESTIPYEKGGPAANVRYNNPAAAWPRPADVKYGLIGYGKLNDGEGNKIGRFPTPVQGAAANFDLFASNYKGMTIKDAMTKWRGRPSPAPAGYDPNEVITSDFLQNPSKAIDFFKKMALHESPTFNTMNDGDWKKAWSMWKTLSHSYTGTLEERKTSFFKTQKPRTADEVMTGLHSVYDDYYQQLATES